MISAYVALAGAMIFVPEFHKSDEPPASAITPGIFANAPERADPLEWRGTTTEESLVVLTSKVLLSESIQ
jgi:hypothetical protein